MGAEMPDKITTLWQDAVDNIRFFKQQQWRVTNYAALIYAAFKTSFGNESRLSAAAS